MSEKIVMTNSDESTSAIFGLFDSNVRKIEENFDVRISNRNTNTTDGDAIVVSGESEGVDDAVKVLEYLKRMSGSGEALSEQSVDYVIGLVKDKTGESIEIAAAKVPSFKAGAALKAAIK